MPLLRLMKSAIASRGADGERGARCLELGSAEAIEGIMRTKSYKYEGSCCCS